MSFNLPSLYELPAPTGIMNQATLTNIKGWLYRRSESGLVKLWRKRWFVLDGTTLYYFHSNDPKEAPSGSYDLSEYRQVAADYDYKKQPYIIRLSRAQRPSLFQDSQALARRYTATGGMVGKSVTDTANDNATASDLRLAAPSAEVMDQWVNALTQVVVDIETRSLLPHNTQLDFILPRGLSSHASSSYQSPASSRKNSDSFEHDSPAPLSKSHYLRKNRSVFSFDMSSSRLGSSPFNRGSASQHQRTASRRNGLVPTNTPKHRLAGLNHSSTNLPLPTAFGGSRNTSSVTLVSDHAANNARSNSATNLFPPPLPTLRMEDLL